MRYNILAGLLALTLGLCVVPSAGSAQSKSGKSCTGQTGECVSIDESESTDLFVNLSRGRMYYAIFDPDTNSTGTATAKVRIFGPCALAPASTNTCEKLIVASQNLGGFDDVDLDGGDASDGAQDRVIWNIAGGLYWIDIVTAPGSGEDAVLSFEVQSQ